MCSLWMEALKTAAHVLNLAPTKAAPNTPYEMWTGKKPSLNYLRVWGCPAEAKVFNPQLKKLDPKIVSCFFVGYPHRGKGYRFYCPGHTTRYVETRQAVFFEDNEVTEIRKIDLEEKRVCAPSPAIQEIILPIRRRVTSHVDPESDNSGPQPNGDAEFNDNENEEPHQSDNENDPHNDDAPPPPPVRRSQRERKKAIPDDYVTYMSEDVNDIGKVEDPTSYKEAIKSMNSSKWQVAMEDELKSMASNDVWDLVEVPNGAKRVGCKWVYKTKYDAKGNIERFKARLVAKGFTQREGIDYNDTFSPVSSKDSFRIVMALVAHFDLELHQMDVKTAFLNGDLDEDVYMAQPEGFVVEGK